MNATEWPAAWQGFVNVTWRGRCHLRPEGIRVMSPGSRGLTPDQMDTLARLEMDLAAPSRA